MVSSNHISFRLFEGIGHLEIDRPEQKNAISRRMWLDIPLALQSLRDEGATVIIIKGTAGVFAAGADLEELKELDTFEDAEKNWHAISTALSYIAGFSLPVIASIEGPCIGGGCLLAVACDLRYAAKSSVFGVPIAKLGIVLDKDNLERLASLIGVSRAKELIFRGNLLSAQDAFSQGLINELCSDEDLENKVLAVASEIKENSLISIQECKLSFSAASQHNARSLNDSHRAIVSSYLSPEFRERSCRILKKE